ncbi:MAG: hypothetical protein IPF67_15935 [Saprospiraceae bacterium]|nr:hypothetical protein [Candidatus Brachybacter algidus]
MSNDQFKIMAMEQHDIIAESGNIFCFLIRRFNTRSSSAPPPISNKI